MMLAEAAYFFHSINDAISFLKDYDPYGELSHIMHDNIKNFDFYLRNVDIKKDDINWVKEGF